MGFPFFEKLELSVNILKPRLDEAEATWIYAELPRDVFSVRRLVVYSAMDSWAANKRSLRRSLAILREVQKVTSPPVSR